VSPDKKNGQRYRTADGAISWMSRKRAGQHLAGGATIISGILEFPRVVGSPMAQPCRPPVVEWRGLSIPMDSGQRGFARYPLPTCASGGISMQYPALARLGAGL
jgi:hypothetical protein